MAGWARRESPRLLAVLALLPAIAGAAERITFHEIHSVALGRPLPLSVVAPATPPPAGAGAVLFYLHGRGRHHRTLLEAPGARAALLAAPFHVVLPTGEDGWYIDSPADPAARYDAYLGEVVAWAEAHLGVGGSAARRGLAGWSMGGYGAVRYAQAQAGQFGFVGSVIGLLDFPRAEDLPEGQNYRVPTARFTADPATWASLNPLHAVERLRAARITLVLATRGFERTMNENFLAALAGRGPAARVHWLEGGHELTLVERAGPTVLADAAEYFAEATR